MYALRDKESQEFLKLSCQVDSDGMVMCSVDRAEHCIEMNYWVTPSLGFVASVLRQESTGDQDYSPDFGCNVDPQCLEVVDLRTHRVVPLNKVFDGYPLDERTILPLVRPSCDDEIIFVER